MIKIYNEDKTIELFNEIFNKYWYEYKPLSDRLCDSMTEERKVCAIFFEVLNKYGYLDKAYIIKKINK